ncbi:C-X-C chemokine receptor type 5 [Bienertia sinuspersici]
MGDHHVVCVDKLIASDTLLSAKGTEVSESSGDSHTNVAESSNSHEHKEAEEDGVSDEEQPLIQILECRICQEEDSVKNLEVPCSCSGSLKKKRDRGFSGYWYRKKVKREMFWWWLVEYEERFGKWWKKKKEGVVVGVEMVEYAHRKCVQKWCNEKGDIICEICHQPYQSGYTAPPPATNDTAIDISAQWSVSGAHIDLNDSRLLAMAAAERHLLEAEYDEYSDSNANGAAFCRSAALILMALLLLRHALYVTSPDGEEDDVSTFFSLFLLRAAGFLLPCYIMAWAISILQRRRQRQVGSNIDVSNLLFSEDVVPYQWFIFGD